MSWAKELNVPVYPAESIYDMPKQFIGALNIMNEWQRIERESSSKRIHRRAKSTPTANRKRGVS